MISKGNWITYCFNKQSNNSLLVLLYTSSSSWRSSSESSWNVSWRTRRHLLSNLKNETLFVALQAWQALLVNGVWAVDVRLKRQNRESCMQLLFRRNAFERQSVRHHNEDEKNRFNRNLDSNVDTVSLVLRDFSCSDANSSTYPLKTVVSDWNRRQLIKSIWNINYQNLSSFLNSCIFRLQFVFASTTINQSNGSSSLAVIKVTQSSGLYSLTVWKLKHFSENSQSELEKQMSFLSDGPLRPWSPALTTPSPSGPAATLPAPLQSSQRSGSAGCPSPRCPSAPAPLAGPPVNAEPEDRPGTATWATGSRTVRWSSRWPWSLRRRFRFSGDVRSQSKNTRIQDWIEKLIHKLNVGCGLKFLSIRCPIHFICG